jgi:hypothetical protein
MCGYAAAAADFIQENVREKKTKKQNAIKYKNKIFKIKKGQIPFLKKNKNV